MDKLPDDLLHAIWVSLLFWLLPEKWRSDVQHAIGAAFRFFFAGGSDDVADAGTPAPLPAFHNTSGNDVSITLQPQTAFFTMTGSSSIEGDCPC